MDSLNDECNSIRSDFSKVIRFDGEGTNIDITSPDNIQWEIDAYNGDLRFYTVIGSDVIRTITMNRD